MVESFFYYYYKRKKIIHKCSCSGVTKQVNACMCVCFVLSLYGYFFAESILLTPSIRNIANWDGVGLFQVFQPYSNLETGQRSRPS